MRRRKHVPYPPPATYHRLPITHHLSPVTRLPGRKMPQSLRGRCFEAAPGRKRYLFLREIRYPPPPVQKNTPNPAQKVPRGGSEQKKASFPAQNGIPPASRAGKRPKSCAEGASRQLRAEKGINSCAEGAPRHSRQKKASFPAQNGIPPASRAEKHPKSCAEGVTEAFRAEKGIISCAELDTTRLPGRKTPQIMRGRCFEAAPGRKRYLFLPGRLQTASTSPPSTTIFLFLAILLFLRKIQRINLRNHFVKHSQIHRFAYQIIKL